MTKFISFDIGIKNLGYCIIELIDTQNIKILEWDIINLCKDNEKTKNISIFQLCSRLMYELETRFIDNSIIPVIENQPVLKNPKMKSIQMMVYSYFVLIGVTNIHLFSPRNKLDVYTGPPVECKLKSKYSRRKYLSVKYTEYIIKNNPNYISIIDKYKKKDDLADALLQIMTFLKKKYKIENIQVI
jgi:hypothetical protein